MGLVTVTEKALEKATAFIAQHAQEQGKLADSYRLKIAVKGGGCAGFEYFFDVTDTKNPDDYVEKKGNLELIIDPMSLMYLNGMTLDYVEGVLQSGFKIQNPNAKGSCGCGSSFSA